MKKLLPSLVIALLISILPGCTDNSEVVDESDFINPEALISDIPEEALSDEEKVGLIQMREEEKLAKDVYIVLYEKWGQNIFNNISKSEQTHTDSIKSLLDRYEIEDPVTNDEVGVYTDSTLQQLYNDLVDQGEESLTEALKVGATIEDLDIKDLDEFVKVTDNEDILIVYQNLLKGSRNHLRSFIKNLERQNGTYEPQFISEEQYSDIIESNNETGVIYNSGGNSL
jgi:hypothetical protein